MVMTYNDPFNSVASKVGPQINTSYWNRKAIVDARKDMYFMPMADVMSMPKNFGKEIKVLQYLPLLDDRNISDQGLDAEGATLTITDWTVSYPSNVLSVANAGKAAAATAINANVGSTLVATAGADNSAGAGFATLTLVSSKSYLRNAATYLTATKDTVLALNLGASVKQNYANLYGSSKDVGTIMGRLPMLTENGGRVNRVGFKRQERIGGIDKFGMFTEFTQESFDFDSDDDLYGHISRELVSGATQLTEAVLQADLLNAATTIAYAGTGATAAISAVTAEGGSANILTYANFLRLATILKENRTPRQTTMMTGSRMIDTKTINNGWMMYCGTEMESTLRTMVDSFNNPAFIPVHQYANPSDAVNGEIGAIGDFRIVVVPEMLHNAGAGAAVSANPGYRVTNNRYNVYPMLVVGAESFTTIGFQMGKGGVKFKIITKMPGEAIANRADPYGEIGFSSIKWYYGILVMRPERLAVLRAVAKQ